MTRTVGYGMNVMDNSMSPHIFLLIFLVGRIAFALSLVMDNKHTVFGAQILIIVSFAMLSLQASGRLWLEGWIIAF